MTNDIPKRKGKTPSEKKAKRKTKRRETYAMYIYKVLKQVSELCARSFNLCGFSSCLWLPAQFTTLSSCLHRFIQIQGFRAEPWASWTPSWTTCLRGLPQKRPGWLSTINAPLSPAERCKLQWGCCCPGSWLNTLCLKAPKLSLSTPAPNEDINTHCANGTNDSAFCVSQ